MDRSLRPRRNESSVCPCRESRRTSNLVRDKKLRSIFVPGTMFLKTDQRIAVKPRITGARQIVLRSQRIERSRRNFLNIDLETRVDTEVELVAPFSRHSHPLIILPSIPSFFHPLHATFVLSRVPIGSGRRPIRVAKRPCIPTLSSSPLP